MNFQSKLKSWIVKCFLVPHVRVAVLCPWHEERTPSCVLDYTAQTYHCMCCGRGGDIEAYTAKMAGLPPPPPRNVRL